MRKETEQLIRAKKQIPALRVIETELEMQNLIRNYFEHITSMEFSDVPSKTDLADWSGVPYSTLNYNLANTYPECATLYIELLADTLTKGAILGKYKEASTIFTLKNRCGWTDKKEITTNAKGKLSAADREEAEEALKALGYIKASKVIEPTEEKNKAK